MSTTEATDITHHHEWFPALPELHAPRIHVQAPGQGKGLRTTTDLFASTASWMRTDPHGQ